MIEVEENFDKICEIARLFLNKEELEKHKQNLKTVLPWFDKMLVDVKIEESHYIYSPADLTDINLFHDEAQKVDKTLEVLSNVPNKKGNLIIVPKVI